jgi:RNA polymerase sigma-70 factor (ECF subfamily)
MLDDDLMRAVAGGDTESLAALYDRYAPRVLGLIRMILHDDALAEDVLQEVFWQVWCRRESYSEVRGPVRGWIFLLARSRAIDARRSRDARQEVSFDGEGLPGARDEQMQQWEQASDLAVPLGLLSVDERQVITLAFWEGWTHREIAAKLQQPLGTVKTRIRLGLRRLADLIADDREDN